MKKLCLSLITISLLFLSGCGSSNDTTSIENETTTSEVSTEIITTTEAATEAISTEETTTEEITTESKIYDVSSVAQELLNQGVITGEPTMTAASMIQAIEGIKYTDQGVEIYEYDTSSDAYKDLVAGKSVPLEGFDGYSLSADAINGKFVLIFSNEPNQTIIDAFSSLNLD